MSRTASPLPLLACLAAIACTSSQEDPPATLTSVATASAGALTVELLAPAPGLATGLTPISLRVTDAAGKPVTDADVTFDPLMTMSGGKTHGAPVIGAPEVAGDGLYHVEVVFQMATSAMGWWGATVDVTPLGSTTVAATFADLPVADSGRSRTFAHFDPDTAVTTKYVASLNFRAAPRVGLNPVVATLHWMETTTSFPPVTDATMTLDPQMPSMGHGSPGSVDPVHTTLGRYAGEVSFSMPGTWETTLTIERGGATLAAPTFTTTF